MTEYAVEFCAHYSGEVTVEADSRDDAAERVREDFAGSGWAFESDDCDVELTIFRTDGEKEAPARGEAPGA